VLVMLDSSLAVHPHEFGAQLRRELPFQRRPVRDKFNGHGDTPVGLRSRIEREFSAPKGRSRANRYQERSGCRCLIASTIWCKAGISGHPTSGRRAGHPTENGLRTRGHPTGGVLSSCFVFVSNASAFLGTYPRQSSDSRSISNLVSREPSRPPRRTGGALRMRTPSQVQRCAD
jgi:hypothetical protein